MDNCAHDYWQKTLVRARARVSENAYERWFLETRGLKLANNTLEVEVPNSFVAEWLRAHYMGLIEDCLEVASGREIQVVFRASDNSSVARVRQEIPVTRQGTNSPSPTRPSSNGGFSLNPKYTFANFVVGPSNQFAHAACQAVAQRQALTYNPLFVYGGVGLGKTHIMQAIGNMVHEKDPGKRVTYVSAENFMNEMIYSIQHAKTIQFRNNYRGVDYLLIDDVQFLAGKESTQEEFFHTFNTLYEAHKQIVVTSDRPPKDIPTLEERLISRFEWGLVTDVSQPDLETRIAILQKKAEAEGADVPNEVISFIAKSVKSNIRELEGSLIRLIAYASVSNREITLEMAREALRDTLHRERPKVSVEQIQRVVADFFDLSPEVMRSRKRTNAVAFPRQIAMYLSRKVTDQSLSEIGTNFGGRDHTTVIHACERITGISAKDRGLRETLGRLERALTERRR